MEGVFCYKGQCYKGQLPVATICFPLQKAFFGRYKQRWYDRSVAALPNGFYLNFNAKLCA
jgi:hypothetical protein